MEYVENRVKEKADGGKRVAKELKSAELGAQKERPIARERAKKAAEDVEKAIASIEECQSKQLLEFLVAVLTTGANNSEVRILSARYIWVCLSDKALEQFFFAMLVIVRIWRSSWS